ncbi:MAG: monooxygenase [Chloroflexales bacterium]|nr:monooxygenase [Chloroflexales bacterium]
MAVTLLQFDFPASGPWGEAMAHAFTDLAQSIAEAPGLIWKIWTENEVTGEQGGIYLFANAEMAEAYRVMHTARLAAFGITEIRAKTFAVNVPLSAITRGPVEA